MNFGKNTYGTAKIVIKSYDGCKYDGDSKKVSETEYNIVRWGIFNLADFNESDRADILNNGMVDEYDEYLKIWTKDDADGAETATFRNSHVDMFRA